ncbi:MAG: GWxTD domain-containing protein, partial [Deltaproteobacteria bacterium]|nr:GWxTD domain-containing protein [Deltaproteobacteria bacterium]
MKTSSHYPSIVTHLILLLLILSITPRTGYGNTREARGGGDFEFFLDSATFMGADGSSQMEMYFRIPNSEIRFKELDNAWRAKVEVEIELLDKDGNSVLREKRKFEFSEVDKETATTNLQFQTVILKMSVNPGDYKVNCRLKDVNSPKLTLLGLARKKYKNSTIIEAPLTVASYSPGTTSLSDPKFLWEINTDAKQVYHPNPTRMYGLYRDSLLVYYELYVPYAEMSGEFYFENVILDSKGEIVKESEKTITHSASFSDDIAMEAGGMNVLEILVTEDLTTLPAGTYTLYTQIGSAGVPLHRSRSGRFSVAWEIRSWESSSRNLLVEARFIMEDEEFEFFKTKSRAEQEKNLKTVWKGLDPNPATGVNEAYETFKARLAYVNAHYSDYTLGAHTDRGMIYMKYGKPDET